MDLASAVLYLQACTAHAGIQTPRFNLDGVSITRAEADGHERIPLDWAHTDRCHIIESERCPHTRIASECPDEHEPMCT